MNLNNIIRRLSNKGAKEIFFIIAYKILLLFQLLIDELLFMFHKRIIQPAPDTNDQLFEKLRNIVWGINKANLVNNINDSSWVISNADRIINGEIELFDQRFFVSKINWFEDPLSKENWPKDLFFSKAKVEEVGLGDVKFVLERNKFHHLVYLALAYFSTSDSKYYEELIKQIDLWIEQCPVNSGVIWKIKLDLAFRNINLIYILLLTQGAPKFNDKFLPMVKGIIKENVKQIKRYSSAKWFKSHKGGNHTIGELVGMMIPMLIFKDLYDDYNYKMFTRQLDEALIDTISDDGVYLEQSASYSKLVAEFLICLDVFQKAYNKRGSDVFKKRLNSLILYLNEIQSNLIVPNFGDCDGAKLFLSKRDYFDISHILYYGKAQLNLPLSIELLEMNLSGPIIKQIDFRKFNKKHTFQFFNSDAGGQFAFKSNDENNCNFFTRFGIHSYGNAGKGSHAHNDLLAILLNIKDIPVFIDKGTLFYNSGIKTRNIDRSSSSHNTISFDNIEQAAFLNKWAYRCYPKYSKSKIDTDNGLVINCEIEYNSIRHSRKIHYNNDNLIISDNLSVDISTKGQISFLLNPILKPIIINDNKIDVYGSNDTFFFSIIIENIEKIQIQKEVYSPLYSKVINTKKILGIFNMGEKTNKRIITTIEI